MKKYCKMFIISFMILIIYMGVCIYNTVNFENHFNPNNIKTTMFNKKDVIESYENNKIVFNSIITFFEDNHSKIELNNFFQQPAIRLRIFDDTYKKYIYNTIGDTEETKEVINLLHDLSDTSRYSHFIIQENHVYYFIMYTIGNTEIGLKYDKNGNEKESIDENWHFYYKRDDEEIYVGRWLYDLLYN